ncbi:hypothetical protein RhiirA4_463193 [Rhizophagus irregularis]|uniref:Uncharacterized protein n=1 Tax=Rhizophagus irregularis TaxID=588596 RepID=A0A2I1GMF1_9GLOM|nr:hypothetical protein RhiirA4_463193 [Rhizophagus irregularis]
MNSHSAYNELTEDIFFNHTFDKDDFAMIRTFKENSTFSKKRVITKENYDIITMRPIDSKNDHQNWITRF